MLDCRLACQDYDGDDGFPHCEARSRGRQRPAAGGSARRRRRQFVLHPYWLSCHECIVKLKPAWQSRQ